MPSTAAVRYFVDKHGEGPGTHGSRHYVSNFYHADIPYPHRVHYHWSEVDRSNATHVVVPLAEYVDLMHDAMTEV